MSGPGPLKTFLDIQGLKALKALRATVNPHLVSELLIRDIPSDILWTQTEKERKSDHTFCINHVKASCGMLFFTKIKSLKKHKLSELIEILGCVHRMTLQKPLGMNYKMSRSDLLWYIVMLAAA